MLNCLWSGGVLIFIMCACSRECVRACVRACVHVNMFNVTQSSYIDTISGCICKTPMWWSVLTRARTYRDTHHTVRYLTSSHLSYSGPVAHKAEVHLLQLALSAATRLASFQLFHPSMRISFSIVDRHVVFGRPTFLLPSGVQVNAVSHLLFLSIRRICPTHFHLLNLTSVNISI